MYGKVFASMYDGTLCANWKALVTFQQFIILADDVGTVDMTPHAISARTGIPLEYIEEGIEVLENDDIYSRSPEQNGRRIERLDDHRPWGWVIINYLKYRNLADHEEKKKKDRERIAQKRAIQNNNENNDLDGCRKVSQSVANVAHTDTDTDTDLSFAQFWKAYPKKSGKAGAEKKWGRLTNTERELAIRDCQSRYIGTDKQFIPYGSTYLNSKPWLDELPPGQKEKPGSYGANAL